jgi:hypothetical protein
VLEAGLALSGSSRFLLSVGVVVEGVITEAVILMAATPLLVVVAVVDIQHQP